MRALATSLTTKLASGATTLCGMLRIDLADGTILAFTDHDRAISFDLGDGLVSYAPDSGLKVSDLELSAGFEPDDFEVTGPIGDDVTRIAVLGGRFAEATVRYFMVDWSALGDGAIKLC